MRVWHIQAPPPLTRVIFLTPLVVIVGSWWYHKNRGLALILAACAMITVIMWMCTEKTSSGSLTAFQSDEIPAWTFSNLLFYQILSVLAEMLMALNNITKEFTAVPAALGAVAAWQQNPTCKNTGAVEFQAWILSSDLPLGCYYTMLGFFLGGLLTVLAVPLASMCLIMEDISSGDPQVEKSLWVNKGLL